MKSKNKKKAIYFKAIVRNYINFPYYQKEMKEYMLAWCKLKTLQRLPLKYCQILVNNYCKNRKYKNKHQEMQTTKRLAKDIDVFDLYALQKMDLKNISKLKNKATPNISLRRIINEGFDYRILFFYKTIDLVYLYEKILDLLNVVIGNSNSNYSYWGDDEYRSIPRIFYKEAIITKKQAIDIDLLLRKNKIDLNIKEENNVR
jgi:hypothetical protein